MGKCFDIYDLPKLNQYQISNLKGTIIPCEIETVIKSLTAKTSSGPDGFSTEFYQMFRKKFANIH